MAQIKLTSIRYRRSIYWWVTILLTVVNDNAKVYQKIN